MTKATDAMRAANKKHGLCNSAEYQSWAGAKKRCFNKNCKSYGRYGGRGITMDSRWKDDFLAFYSDMGPRPSPKHSIDRFPDNNGNYEPGNCRWATPNQQGRNRRSSRMVELAGERMSLIEACERLDLDYDRVNDRLLSGWSFDEAIGAAARVTPQRILPIENPKSASGVRGVRKSGRKWVAVVGSGPSRQYLGTFETPELALASYLASKAKIRGGGFRKTRNV